MNRKPSRCLADLVDGCETCIEVLLAYVVVTFEDFYHEFMSGVESDNPFMPFLDRYYKHWLHMYFHHFIKGSSG
jgi:hypothetical protein